MNRIKKGDEVIVTAGKDKGKRGDVVRVVGDKVVVSNVNIVKRHTKPNPQANQPGGVIEREAPIHVSNVMLFNPASGKGERVATKVLENGTRLRIRLGVALDDVDVGDDHAIAVHTHHVTTLALVLAGDDDHLVAFLYTVHI